MDACEPCEKRIEREEWEHGAGSDREADREADRYERWMEGRR
jgi:hypothetical protein